MMCLMIFLGPILFYDFFMFFFWKMLFFCENFIAFNSFHDFPRFFLLSTKFHRKNREFVLKKV